MPFPRNAPAIFSDRTCHIGRKHLREAADAGAMFRIIQTMPEENIYEEDPSFPLRPYTLYV